MEDPDAASLLKELLLLNEVFFRPVTFHVILGVVVMLLLLMASALISGSEIAFFSLNPTQRKQLRADHNSTHDLVNELLERPKRLLATILITNNFVNVAIIVLSTYVVANLVDLSRSPVFAFVVQVVVVTSLLLIVGEIMPKIYASTNPMKFAVFMARPLRALITIFYPLSSLLVKSSSLIDRRLQRNPPQLSMSELSEAIELTSNNDTDEDDRKILKGIVKFGDIDAKEIMKPRLDVTAVEINTSYAALMELILDAGYSRIPAYTDNFDKIVGILYVKDLLPHLDEPADFNWKALLRPAFFVPENKKINDLLQEFQQKKIHMAIMVDEYGGTSGIVTLEDVLEEIVGEISDEFDSEEDEIAYTKIDDNNYLFEGKILLNDFCKILNIEDRLFEYIKGDSETLAGLILEIEGRIPPVNASTKFLNFEFIIKKVSNRRIEEILTKIT
ncbi:MAG: gliding motility-associated protein GldE [Bacteroidales bacterium]|nr:gliding motility-associated protein GldE [Bacteroidales bacterium]MDD2631186.1 gliding motility-associated protein GldE [Bacteroidales bacterium]MDD3527559.1 gliding motility-associated protein GldE [Bacteroidales bacterium]MDD4175534.1 gliding motility-associated protein GldE [Bacteroidales bacterium]MDD4742284.1 gliding motility-associated protein GldE [Bacteroidales bacterium]